MKPLPGIPLDYKKLSALINSGVYPAERNWLEFKERLFPAAPVGKPTKAKTPNEVFDELARDLASLAVYGGFLIYGVRENKANHTFTVVDMELPRNLDQQVVNAARTRITSPLEVEPTLLTNPANPSSGLMVIEIPSSPEAPHNVRGTYFTRSSVGKEPMRDDEVERLILRRRKADQLLTEAMHATREAVSTDPANAGAHLYLTALPTHGHRDMFADYTRNQSARVEFLARVSKWASAFSRTKLAVPGRTAAFYELHDHRRTQATRGAWFQHVDRASPHPWRAIGLDDDGIVRFYDRTAGSRRDGVDPVDARYMAAFDAPPSRAPHRGAVIYEDHVWHDTVEFLAFVGLLAAEAGYTGAWRIGLTIDDTNGRGSAQSNGWRPVTTHVDTDELHATARASTPEIRNAPRDVAARLVGPITRELGTEHLLAQWNAS